MPSAIDLFGALLDRSIDQIAQVSADARQFDAALIRDVADVWDNNTLPFVASATAGPLSETFARMGLRWMADLGPERRSWMIETEPAIADLLPAPRDDRFARDYDGRVIPTQTPLAGDAPSGLADDYDLDGAMLRSMAMEQRSDGLAVSLAIEAPRRYSNESPDADQAVLYINLDNVQGLRFEATDRGGVSISCSESGVAVGIGERGIVRGASGNVYPNDSSWHLSRTGRAADLATPRGGRSTRARAVPLVGLLGAPWDAAHSICSAMIEIRRVRYRELAGQVPTRELCQAYAGAGRDIIDAARRHGRVRRQAFQRLIRTWRERGGDIEEVDPVALANGPSVLRYARFTAKHAEWGHRRDATAVVNIAMPPSNPGPWRLAAREIREPSTFEISLSAFAGTRDLALRPNAITLDDGLIIHGDGIELLGPPPKR